MDWLLQTTSQTDTPDQVLPPLSLPAPGSLLSILLSLLSLAPFFALCPPLFDLSFHWSPSPLVWRTRKTLEVGREEERGLWREGGVCLAQVRTCHWSLLIIYDVSCFSKHFPISYY